jgi:hypothetical protein
MQGVVDAPAPAIVVVEAFVGQVRKALPQAPVQGPPSRRRTRRVLPATNNRLSRCSYRVTVKAKQRMANPVIQAQSIMLKKCHPSPMRRSLDTAAVKAYDDIYRSPLGSIQHKVIRALFIAGYPGGRGNALDG